MVSAAATGGYKWVEERDGYLLSLRLPGLKREDILVCVDGKHGRLTITNQRKPTPGNGEAAQLKKTFKLPKTANPDKITCRFDGEVLTLTVPTKGSQKPSVTAAAAKKKEEEERPKANKEEPTEAKVELEKKLIDTAVAAFKLGVLFSHRLFRSSPAAGTNNHI